MIVPKEIEDSINKSALHRSIANEENEKIRKWLDEKGLGENDFIIEYLIDSIEIGNYPSNFIKFLKKDAYKY